jgi:hypothetical protein
VRCLFLMCTTLMLSSCARDCDHKTGKSDEVQGIDLSGFSEMVSPIRYNEIVAQAESGDESSIAKLIGYYSQGGYKNIDFRNLKYWSEKSYQIHGSKAFTNVIIFSADNQLCEQSWQYFDRYFKKSEEFGFYSKNGKLEYINEKCPRPLELRI